MALEQKDFVRLASLLWTLLVTIAELLLNLPSDLACSIANSVRRTRKVPEQEASGVPTRGATFYEGIVTHIRKSPLQNAFKYSVRMAVVDLDNPPSWWSKKQAEDHLSASEARKFASTSGPVRLLTHPASAGYLQNPISVYYCYEKPSKEGTGGVLRRCIAEVTNTPWAERTTFCFNPAGQDIPKSLHVSPLMDMEATWHLKAPDPGEHLYLSVAANHPEYGAFFHAYLKAARSGAPNVPNERAGLGTMWRYGYEPQRVALWIYYEAAKLLLRGATFYKEPPRSIRARAASTANNPRNGLDGKPFMWRDGRHPWTPDS